MSRVQGNDRIKVKKMKKQTKMKLILLSLFLMLSTSLMITFIMQRNGRAQIAATENCIIIQRATSTFTVSPLSWYSWYLTSQLTVNGNLQYSWTVIAGGQSSLQAFYILDSANYAKLQAGQDCQGYKYVAGAHSNSGTFTIPYTDHWYLIFDMQTSLWNSVTVQATMTYTPPYTPPNTPSVDWSAISGVIIFLVIIVVLLIVAASVHHFLKSRSQAPISRQPPEISTDTIKQNIPSKPISPVVQAIPPKRFCVFCGIEIEQDATFCTGCGKQQR